MRERFDDTFYEEVNSFMGTAFGDSELDAKLKEFIEQEIKKEREEILQMIENYLWLARYGNDDDLNPVYERAFEEIINTIKNRT